MCFGTVLPAVWLGSWKQSKTKHGILILWIAASLAPILPAVAITVGADGLTTTLAAVSCALFIACWWWCYDGCFRRIFQNGPTIHFRRGSISGAALSLGYPLILVTLHFNPARWVVAGAATFGAFLILLGGWVKASYELVTSADCLKHLGDRPSMDRMIGSLYIMYVGQAGAILVGTAVLFFDVLPVDWLHLSVPEWQTVGAFAIGLGFLHGARFKVEWLYPGLLIAATVGLMSASWLLVASWPTPNWVAFFMAFFAAYGVFDSVLSNGFWHHARRPNSKDMVALALLAISCLVVLYWAFGSTADSLHRYGRDDVAGFFSIAVLGWLYYIFGTFAIVRASDRGGNRPVLTQNSPGFNFAHDSLIVVCALLFGLIPLAWTARAGWPTSTGNIVVDIVGAIVMIGTAITLIAMGIYSGHLHRKAQRSNPDRPWGHDWRMWRQWGSVVLLAGVGWFPLIGRWITGAL